MIPDKTAKFIATLARQFMPPKHEGDLAEAWMRDYADELERWSAETLAVAARIIRSTRTDRRFPLPAECAAACVKADGEIAKSRRDANLLSHGERDQSPWATWRCDLADTLIKTPMGKRAADGGWVVMLWNFCREHGRLPDEAQASAMARAADDIPDLVDRLEAEGGTLTQACAAFGRTFLARRRQMAEFIAGRGKPIWRQ